MITPNASFCRLHIVSFVVAVYKQTSFTKKKIHTKALYQYRSKLQYKTHELIWQNQGFTWILSGYPKPGSYAANSTNTNTVQSERHASSLQIWFSASVSMSPYNELHFFSVPCSLSRGLFLPLNVLSLLSLLLDQFLEPHCSLSFSLLSAASTECLLFAHPHFYPAIMVSDVHEMS